MESGKSDEPHAFYVYAYLRSRDSENGPKGSPYYIGKGKRDRAYAKNHRVPPPPDKDNIVFLGWHLTEAQALAAEVHFIRYYGRLDIGTGCLRNLTDGGDGRSNPSAETRRKMSEARARRVTSDETRRKISAAHRGMKRSPEARRNISEGQRGRVLSEEHRRKISENNRGNKYRQGKTFSLETRRKISEALKGRKIPEEVLRKRMKNATIWSGS